MAAPRPEELEALVNATVAAEWRTVLEQFALYQRGAALSEKTIIWRENLLLMVASMSGHSPVEVTLTDLLHVVTRKAARSGQPLAPGTRQGERSSLRTFFEWLQAEEWRTDNPALRLPKVKIPRRRPRPLRREQIERMLDSGVYTRTRDIIMIASLSGLRIGEIVKIRGEDVDLDAGTVFSARKGSDPMSVGVLGGLVGQGLTVQIRGSSLRVARGCRQAAEALVFIERTAIGLDVHARSVRAAAIDSVTGEVIEARLPAVSAEIVAWIVGVGRRHGPVHAAYEAGPTGFGLARKLEQAQIARTVAAPSKMLRPAGDRVKTDVRDAVLIARLLRMDELVAVRVPTVAQESARDLVRAREDARIELMAARHRLSKLLLRHGIVYDGTATWNRPHDAWLRRVRKGGLDGAGTGTLAAFDAAFDTVTLNLARRDRLEEQITALAAGSEFAAITSRLCCLRGINTLTGFALTVEIGDWDRFTGRTIASYLGLVPSEHSSGGSRSLGAITKTGNTHARRLLIEAAWHHKPDYRPGKAMTDRWAKAPAQAAARGDAGNRRLHHRWTVLAAHKKKHTVACTAIARELAGWCWSLAVMDG